ncbi:MAG: hypothetical protein K9M44_01330 [Candidatus Pacebacteria bacterium]|nr:hypothetical protein [Candidatus Paceibacterota bacterium]
MLKIKIKLDLEKDAWNWWDACNKISNGVDWKNRIEENLQKKIVNKTKKQAFNFLLPYLQRYYYSKNIQLYINDIQKGFTNYSNKIFLRTQKITGKPILQKNFTLFLTSFPRLPYVYDKGYIWISDKKTLPYQLEIFIHELLHFQYFQYFGEGVWNKLGAKGHADIKEAMTVIINEEFSDITHVKDEGYEIHKNLRKKLLEIWLSCKNMDEFMNQAILYYKKNGL